MMRGFGLAAAVLWTYPALAGGSAPAPKAFVCEFAAGNAASYESGGFVSRPPAATHFEIRDIDLEKQSAALGGGANGAPAGKLAVARAIGANHFLEIANEGYWTVTTIYDADSKSGRHPAVHSRHLGVLGQPLVAQYTGSCSSQ